MDKSVKGTDTLHPPYRHCIHNVFSSQSGSSVGEIFEVERGTVFEGGVCLERNRGIFVEDEHFVGGERKRVTRTGHGDVGGRGRGDGGEKGVTSDPETTGWGVVIIGVETRAFFLPFSFKSALVR